MKRFLIVIVALLLFVPFAHAEQPLAEVEVRPDLDRYQLSAMKLRLYPVTYIEIWLDFAEEGGGYDIAEHRKITITNRDISYNLESMYRDDAQGNMPGLPPDYVANPATKILQEMNLGTFDGQGSLDNYLEVIVKTIFGL